MPRIAPTERVSPNGAPLRGVVHDPTARNMGGVAGHAGVFSTADDLARFAQMMLNGGELDGVRLFSPLTVEKFTEPQSPPDQPILRGLGWDIDSPLSGNRGELFPIGSYRAYRLHRHLHLDRSIHQDLRDPAGQQRAPHGAPGADAAARQGGDHRGGRGGNRRYADVTLTGYNETFTGAGVHREVARNGATQHRPRRPGGAEVPAVRRASASA